MRLVAMVPGIVGASRRRQRNELELDPELRELVAPDAPPHEAVHVRSLAGWRAVSSREDVVVIAPHSRGIYPALVMAGCVTCATALDLERRAWAAIVGAGRAAETGLLAVAGGDSAATARVVDSHADIHVAIRNSPLQVILGGPSAQLDALTPQLEEAGALSVQRLSIPAAVHTPALAEAAAALRADMADHSFADPKTPILDATVRGGFLERGSEVRDFVSRQLCESIEWGERLLAIPRDDYDAFVDLGPGETLARVVPWLGRDLPVELAEDFLAP